MKATFRRALMLHWLAREPWLTSTQLGVLTGEANLKLLLHYLHDLSETGWVQRVNIGEPDLPSAHVYALTDAGLRELARLEGMTCVALSQQYLLNETTLLNTFNRLPFFFDVRQYLLCPLVASQHQYPHVQLRIWSWRRHLAEAHQFKFKGWYGTTR